VGGGGTTVGQTTRPIRRLDHLSDYPQRCVRSRTRAQEGCSAPQIAQCLEHEGYQPPKHAKRFSRPAVYELMQRLGVQQRRAWRRAALQAHEWWLSEFTRRTGISSPTLHTWRTPGWLNARWHPQPKRWVAWADAAALERLRQRHALPAGHYSRKVWLDEPASAQAERQSVSP
jgi:hypothetical protein